MSLFLFVITLAGLMFMGLPIVTAMLGGSAVYFLLNGIRMDIMVRQMMNGIDSFVLLAIPFFILSAQIMNGTDITRKMFDFADKLVGHIKGGLCHVNVLTSVIFSGMSGSAIADTCGIGYMATDAMIKKGFNKPFSAALTITSAIVGPVIPPSIPMVMYAVISGASLGALFLGGVIPGLLISLSLSIYCYLIADKYRFPISPRPSLKELFKAFKASFFPLMTPVILLVGIYTGAFTPTEAAVVCTFYAIIVGFVMNRNMNLKQLVPIAREVLLQTGITMFVIAAINVFRWIIVREQIPNIIADFVIQMSIPKPLMLALLNIVFLILGCFLPLTTIMLAFVPILLPILPLLQIDLVHFGVVLTINLMIGLVTPPFGMQLFVINGLTKVPISEIVRKVWPQLACVGIVLILITYYEPLVLWLPNMMK